MLSLRPFEIKNSKHSRSVFLKVQRLTDSLARNLLSLNKKKNEYYNFTYILLFNIIIALSFENVNKVGTETQVKTELQSR
jgi:hypothetical protein